MQTGSASSAVPQSVKRLRPFDGRDVVVGGGLFQAASVSSITRRPQMAGEPMASLPRMALIEVHIRVAAFGHVFGSGRKPSCRPAPHTSSLPLRMKNTPFSHQMVISSWNRWSRCPRRTDCPAPRPQTSATKLLLMSTGTVRLSMKPVTLSTGRLVTNSRTAKQVRAAVV